MRSGNRVLGVLAVYGPASGRLFSDDEVQMLETLVRHADVDVQVASAVFALVEATPEQARLRGDTALLADASASAPREGGCLELAAGVAWRIDRARSRVGALRQK